MPGNEPSTAPQARSGPLSGPQARFALPAWRFLLLSLLLLVFWLLLGLLGVTAVAYQGYQVVSDKHHFDRGWALIAALALLWAVVNLYWRTKARTANSPLAVHGHLAIAVGCGLVSLGIYGVIAARAWGTDPIVIDQSQLFSTATAGSVDHLVTEMPGSGDVEEGRKIFATSCVTCHGPRGEGLPSLAPSLRGSAFIAAADDAAIHQVIRLGRAVSDPANKSGKVMPARGGNPFLGDDKIVHLVAFVRAIQSESPTLTQPGAAADAPPPVQLAKWVVPEPAAPPGGMNPLDDRLDIGDTTAITRRSQQRREAFAQTLSLGLTGIHGLFLLGVMMMSGGLLWKELQTSETRLSAEHGRSRSSWWTWLRSGWITAAVTWGLIFVMGFVVN